MYMAASKHHCTLLYNHILLIFRYKYTNCDLPLIIPLFAAIFLTLLFCQLEQALDRNYNVRTKTNVNFEFRGFRSRTEHGVLGRLRDHWTVKCVSAVYKFHLCFHEFLDFFKNQVFQNSNHVVPKKWHFPIFYLDMNQRIIPILKFCFAIWTPSTDSLTFKEMTIHSNNATSNSCCQNEDFRPLASSAIIKEALHAASIH